ncbi:MAG: phosphoribosylformylglycinamidine synthase subunit PurL, partial [Planctomycetaceae bacterium]|nr:phosphoribosylformylglycinamidine synthase subunit PurL [Planctomycetaceae bacterium]
VGYGKIPFTTLHFGSPYKFKLGTVPMRGMDDEQLQRFSKEGQLYLTLIEMQTIRDFYVQENRDPTDVELETFAQTWSEHCSHKTLGGRIHFVHKDADGNVIEERQYENMLKETIFAATRELCEKNPDVAKRCVSVFADNAGVVTFDEEYNVTFKAETHNRPSAIEPYGGAHTGLGGCMRDTMGTGLGAKPIASTSVTCVAPPDIDPADIPAGVLHPRRILKNVAAGARDYGNRMGVPLVNGAIYFDKRYLANPIVCCGNIGLIPKDKSFKEPKPGDLIVALGARTGKDGIHGATFSSGELTDEGEALTGGKTQIGDAIIEKMYLDVMLEARDRNLYHAVTDCGAGGFSSAIGEMGEKIGAEVELSHAPLKYEGLSYTEIWISESQERMVLAMPPENWDEFRRLCESEDVEATVMGTFQPTGRLVLKYQGQQVADIDMKLLHKGRPPVVREAVYQETTTPAPPKEGNYSPPSEGCPIGRGGHSYKDILLKILSSPNVASKHWFIRQCDHEVQGGSVIKPLVGAMNDGPSDAAVIRPRLDSRRGLVISCGMNPMYGDLDPYAMAASAIDEAVRNAVCVGADPKTISLLDNFCWGNTDRPETLGTLVRAAQACYDVAMAYQMPFISGKDSLNNEYRPAVGEPISIPPTLLISAMGQIDDVSKCVTMDLKKAGNLVYLLGETHEELGGSHFNFVQKLQGADVPFLNPMRAKILYETLHTATMRGLIRSAHDTSEGGLAVAIAEMCIAGDLGATLTGDFDIVDLFSESNCRFVVEVEPERVAEFESLCEGFPPIYRLGTVTTEPVLSFGDLFSVSVAELKSAWQGTLDW